MSNITTLMAPWSRLGAVETSLITDCKKIKHYGDPYPYGRKMYYYNSVLRWSVKKNIKDS